MLDASLFFLFLKDSPSLFLECKFWEFSFAEKLLSFEFWQSVFFPFYRKLTDERGRLEFISHYLWFTVLNFLFQSSFLFLAFGNINLLVAQRNDFKYIAGQIIHLKRLRNAYLMPVGLISWKAESPSPTVFAWYRLRASLSFAKWRKICKQKPKLLFEDIEIRGQRQAWRPLGLSKIGPGSGGTGSGVEVICPGSGPEWVAGSMENNISKCV